MSWGLESNDVTRALKWLCCEHSSKADSAVVSMPFAEAGVPSAKGRARICRIAILRPNDATKLPKFKKDQNPAPTAALDGSHFGRSWPELRTLIGVRKIPPMGNIPPSLNPLDARG